MNSKPKLVSMLGLAMTVVPCILFFTGAIALEPMKWAVLAGTITWFLSAPLWIGRTPEKTDSAVEA